jgi:4-amino-4-deoxy-L-arabinose transferase-like glycosyltransferase
VAVVTAGTAAGTRAPGRDARRARFAVAALFAAAAAQRAWNAWSLPPLIGYDAPGHAGYIVTILEEWRLPHPTEGWMSYHPPLYYLLGAVVWRILDPLGAHAILVGLRAIGSVAGLAAAGVAWRLLRGLDVPWRAAWVATAVLLFLPCNQMQAAMVGNEALAAGFAALALPPLLALQRDPGDRRAAVSAGLFAGLSLATKYTGAWVAAACVLPFLRAAREPRARVACAMWAVMVILVAGPVYVRNVAITGTPLPRTGVVDPVRAAESAFVLRERRLADYLWFDPRCLLRPTIVDQDRAGTWKFRERNRHLTNVWGALYASVWSDSRSRRIPDRPGLSVVLAVAGLLPTLVMLRGVIAAGVDLIARRGASRDASLVVFWLFGMTSFAAFTWGATSLVYLKGNFLLPLALPAAVFFARGVASCPGRLRRWILVLSATVALVAAVVLTNGVISWAPPLDTEAVARWRTWSMLLPTACIEEAMARLMVVP